jgi:hypothetical protein
VAAAVLIVLLFVMLPEIIGDRPYDPEPSRITHTWIPVLVDHTKSAPRSLERI